MNKLKSNQIILVLSLILTMLIIISSSIGIFTGSFYSSETPNWQVQSVGQDMIDLFLISPVLIISSFLAHRNNKMASLVHGGALVYVIYTFTIYCFNVHFNELFIIYCLILGLSFYSFIYFSYSYLKNSIVAIVSINQFLSKAIGIYFVTISIIFYLLWLSEIVPAMISGYVPKTVVEAGLFTNPVHVLDLAVILPGIFITGILVFKKYSTGFFLAPVMLTFFILMDLTIAFLMIMMIERGFEGSMMIAGIMVFLALTSFALLVWHFKLWIKDPIKIKNAGETRLMI